MSTTPYDVNIEHLFSLARRALLAPEADAIHLVIVDHPGGSYAYVTTTMEVPQPRNLRVASTEGPNGELDLTADAAVDRLTHILGAKVAGK